MFIGIIHRIPTVFNPASSYRLDPRSKLLMCLFRSSGCSPGYAHTRERGMELSILWLTLVLFVKFLVESLH